MGRSMVIAQHVGARAHPLGRSAQLHYLLNNTMFYQASERLTVGLELD